MDDPWANAWGETPRDTLNPPAPTWSSPIPDVEEPAVQLPSWISRDGIQWTEPVDTDSSLWLQPETQKPWDASYEHLPVDAVLSAAPEHTIQEPDDESAVSDDKPASAPVSPPDSPDAFGTFESAPDTEAGDPQPWSPAPPDVIDAWGSAWQPPAPSRSPLVRDDEWAAARRHKELQDRQVPPELLASILQQFEQLSQDLWPNKEDFTAFGKNLSDARDNWRSGMEGVDGLETAADKLIPEDLLLPLQVPFSKTFASKSMTEALKLTRHAPITRISPLAQYMASKGSTAWETYLKSRPEAKQEDLVPPGWRVLGKEKEDSSPTTGANKKKASSGLLAFWGRKSSTISQTNDSAKASRPSSPVPVPHKPTPPASPRPSTDSMKSPHETASSPTITTTPIVLPNRADASLPVASNFSLPAAAKAAQPEPSPVEISREPTPPPSAVSRFLNRFSRTKSNQSMGSSPRSSIALSSDDLEFLSDVIPSASETDDEDTQLKALSAMVQSTPLPPKHPSPIAPPPRPSLLPLRGSESSSDKNAVHEQDIFTLEPSAVTLNRALPAITTTQVVSTSSSAVASLPSSADLDVSRMMDMLHFPVKTPSPTVSTFLPPTSSRSRSETPAPASSKRPPVTAIMATTSGRSTPIPSTSAMTLPPPPVSRAQPVTLESSSFIFPPPPTSRTPTTPSAPPKSLSPPSSNIYPLPSPQVRSGARPLQQPLFDDDEDFSDFHSPPPPLSPPNSQATPVPNPSTSFYDTSFSSASSGHSLVSTPNTHNTSGTRDLFDDFDDFVSSSSVLNTPSPPRLPSKNSPPTRAGVSNARIVAVTTSSSPPRRRLADHQRTQSLVESAAARTGQWPAPPSPIPEALPPPPGSSAPSSNVLDAFFNGGRPKASLSTSVSSPAKMATSHKSSLSQSQQASSKQRTLSLLETAAARPGRWPAPLSPLPEALPPPPGAASHDLFGPDPFSEDDSGSGNGSTMQRQQAAAAAGLRAMHRPPSLAAAANGSVNTMFSFPPPPPSQSAISRPSSRAASPPTGAAAQPQSFSLFGMEAMPLPAKSADVSKFGDASGGSSAKGLSAQDLSFFEGL